MANGRKSTNRIRSPSGLRSQSEWNRNPNNYGKLVFIIPIIRR